MPFCPNCKAEYQEGFTECSDCKIALVEDIKEAELLVPFFQADDKKVAEKLVKFFNYSDVTSTMEYDEENDLYIVSIPPKKQMQAKRLYQAFYFVERERLANGESDLLTEDSSEADSSEEEGSETDRSEEGIETEAGERADGSADETGEGYEEDEFNHSLGNADTNSTDEEHSEDTPSDEVTAFDEDDVQDDTTYVMKADQYKDLNGTVWVFLFFGIAGLIVVALNVIGILSFFNGWIPNTVMGALFLFFIYVAVSTNSKAKKVRAEINEENALTEKINEWLKLTVTEEFLTSIHNENISDEFNYIKKTDTIKEMLLKEFGTQNLSYLDRLIEEFYNNTFDN